MRKLRTVVLSRHTARAAHVEPQSDGEGRGQFRWPQRALVMQQGTNSREVLDGRVQKASCTVCIHERKSEEMGRF